MNHFNTFGPFSLRLSDHPVWHSDLSQTAVQVEPNDLHYCPELSIFARPSTSRTVHFGPYSLAQSICESATKNVPFVFRSLINFERKTRLVAFNCIIDWSNYFSVLIPKVLSPILTITFARISNCVITDKIYYQKVILPNRLSTISKITEYSYPWIVPLPNGNGIQILFQGSFVSTYASCGGFSMPNYR